MPYKWPNGPDFSACPRMLLDQGVAATTSRDHRTPHASTDDYRGPLGNLASRLDATADRETDTGEWFGPDSFFVGTDSTEHSLSAFRAGTTLSARSRRGVHPCPTTSS
ncbi:hypothetical protein [Streptomyces neyagawaensis]|uniref:hypothetical protein n=1 Tax=Streptomyces neyagawaensis TaxID=42238 RepID=UPI0006E21083|nr:hypothetical protein [Streptomyces neyagawaensis]MCL6731858.1 hypothetical protein [Streptomyces neyagawaensis]MDE1682651.1 hypothetical protein [Streptomyces neyagawaensis]